MYSEPQADFRKVTGLDADYPKALQELADRPPVLYVKGRWPLPARGVIGLVGTRRASPYGLAAAERLTTDLVRQDVVTVSGLAVGVDACVHRVTLKEGGWTVAVLGHGFRYEYPKENALLFSQIAERGTLVTEFSYETRPEARHFPQRNRIISGLAQGVVVIEAGGHSGALITARYAAEQGRDVFAVPGSIFEERSAGCHRLIKEGAKLVERAEDILEEYGMTLVQPKHNLSSFPPAVRGESMDPPQTGRTPEVWRPPLTPAGDDVKRTPLENELLKLLSSSALSVDDLAMATHQPVDRLASALLSLELEGTIRSLPGQRYHRNHKEREGEGVANNR